MKPKKIIIVNEKDNVTEYKNRDTIKQEDIYRVSALWITNSDGQILLSRRALNKSHDPGKWSPAVAGTVEEGEDYEVNILKEAEEEIGLKDIKPQIGPKERVSGEHNFFVQWYLLEIDKPINEFVVNQDEVGEIKWFLKKDLRQKIENDSAKFSKTMDRWIQLFCR